MTLSAILFGSIGVLSETSDMQRRAYNAALREAGLGWEWDVQTYRELLEMSGGRDRLGMLAHATGTALNDEQIRTIHARKTELACAEVRDCATLRPGVAQLARMARDRGLALGFVTSTYTANIDAILDAAGSALRREDFAVIVSRDEVEHGKPAPDPYTYALAALGITADQAIAIEDTNVSIASARRAGLQVIATPGAFTGDQDFHEADLVCADLADAEGALDPRLLEMINQDLPVQLHAMH